MSGAGPLPSGYYDWLRRLPSALRAAGERAGRKRVARLMRGLGIRGVTRRRWKTATTKRDAKARPAPDLVNRDFSANGPDQLWVADIAHMRAELVEGALAMAVSNRKPGGRVVHHSGQGSRYTSPAFGKHCREAGIAQSMGSAGDACDNAMCESFFATLECELLDRSGFPVPADARREVFRFIEGFHNTRRIHSALGYESPASFEELSHAA